VASNRSTAAQLKTNGFKDVSASDWFANDLCVAKSLGIIKGYPDGNFKPNKSVSVAEAAKIVVVGLAKQKLSEGNPWYQSYIDYLVQKNAVPTTV
jgi:middle cell wall protein